MDKAKILFDEFLSRGRQDVVGAAKAGQTLGPWRGQPNVLMCQRHVDGVGCLGVYLHLPNNTTNLIAVDLDDHAGNRQHEVLEECQAITETLDDLEVEHLIEVSQSGSGRHVWVFLDKALPCKQARNFAKQVLKEAGITSSPEIYPRSDELPSDAIGNMVRIPLWNKSQCDLSKIQRVEASQIASIASQYKDDPVAKPVVLSATEGNLSDYTLGLLNDEGSYLHSRWNGSTEGLSDQSGSAVALSLADGLVRAYVPTEEVALAVRMLCERLGKPRKDAWINRTVAKAYGYARGTSDEVTMTTTDLREVAKELAPKLIDGRTYYGFGIDMLDAAVDGLAAGQFGIWASRPASGKSAAALQGCDHNASLGIPSLFVSLEMDREELVIRAIQRITGLEESEFGKHPDKVIDAATKVSTSLFVSACRSDLNSVVETIKNHVIRKSVKFVAVDYLQLIECDSHSGEHSERLAIVKSCTVLKNLAKELGIAILALAQLNRGADIDRKSLGRNPDLDTLKMLMPGTKDLQGSSRIEQHADVIITTLLPELQASLRGILPPSTLLVDCPKRRGGPRRGAWPIQLHYDMVKQRLESQQGRAFNAPDSGVQFGGSFEELAKEFLS